MNMKTQIMSVAQNLIQKNGIDSFSFRTLANEVNIKSASVHYHFPKKDDLIAEIAKNYNQDFFKALDDINQTNASSKNKLKGLLKLFEATKKNDKVCLCAMLASASDKLDENSNNELNYFFTKLSSWTHDILREAKAKQEVNSSLPIKSLANLLVASLEGALLIDKVNDNHSYLKSCKDLIDSALS